MTKQELVASVAKDCYVNRQTAQAVIENALSCIRKSVANGDAVFLRGFGTFKPQLRKAKKARNIKQGTSLDIPPHYVVKLIPGAEFRKMMSGYTYATHK